MYRFIIQWAMEIYHWLKLEAHLCLRGSLLRRTIEKQQFIFHMLGSGIHVMHKITGCIK